MKITSDSIKLGNNTFEATQVDYNSYSIEKGNMEVLGKVYESIKIIGLESLPNLICSNSLLCSESAII